MSDLRPFSLRPWTLDVTSEEIRNYESDTYQVRILSLRTRWGTCFIFAGKVVGSGGILQIFDVACSSKFIWRLSPISAERCEPFGTYGSV